MTRNEAIEIMNRTIDALAPDLDSRFTPGQAFSCGARSVLRSLIQAGAFDDGLNWSDRLPLLLWENVP